MGIFDSLLVVPLLYAAYKGFREGIVLQLGGIIGLVIGVYLAFRHCETVGGWFGLDGAAGAATGFLVIFIVVLLVISLLGKACSGLFKIAGLGAFDSVGGIVLSVIKMALLLSVLLTAFDTLNAEKKWVEPETAARSFLYKPIRDTAGIIFPYLHFVTDKLSEIK